MVNSLGATIFFIIAEIWLFAGVFGMRKSKSSQPGVTWIIVLLVMLNCFHCLVAAVMSAVHIPITIISIGLVDAAAGVYFWYQIKKKGKKQTYEWKWVDAIFLLGVIALVVYVAKLYFGGADLTINFMTIDPANHFRAAMDTVDTGKIAAMYYETIWNGLLIESLLPFVAINATYHVFVASELINLALSGLVIYAIFRKYAKGVFAYTAAVILGWIYLLGYPLNSMMYGFVYLDMAVVIIGVLIILADCYLRDEIDKHQAVLFLMLGCLGLFICYVLFMPVVFLALILCFFIKQKRQGKLKSKETILVVLAIFLITCVVGFYFIYANVFTDGVTVFSAIANEGAIYRDLYSNFLPWAPFAIFGLVYLFKKKENCLLRFLAPITVLFTVVLFVMTMTGKASTYYFYKTYFLIWLLVFVLDFYAVVYAEKQTKVLMGSCFFIWLCVFGMYELDAEAKLKYHNKLIVSTQKADSLNDILAYNQKYLYREKYTAEKLELYDYAYDNCIMNSESLVPLAGNWEDDLWYQAITNQRYSGWGTSDEDHTEYFNHLADSDAEYIVVLTDKNSAVYQDTKEYFDGMEKVYENSAGFVAKMP